MHAVPGQPPSPGAHLGPASIRPQIRAGHRVPGHLPAVPHGLHLGRRADLLHTRHRSGAAGHRLHLLPRRLHPFTIHLLLHLRLLLRLPAPIPPNPLKAARRLLSNRPRRPRTPAKAHRPLHLPPHPIHDPPPTKNNSPDLARHFLTSPNRRGKV